MKRIFDTTGPGRSFHLIILVVRVLVGSFMLTHGYPKLGRLTSGEQIKFADPFGFGPGFSLVLVVFAEFLCSIFLIIGFGTRIASAVLIITMLVAAFHAHGADPFATKEKALLFAVIFFALIFFGSGKYAVDRLIGNR